MINDIKAEINKLGIKVDDAFNHMSRRLPLWATLMLSLLFAIVTGLIVGRS